MGRKRVHATDAARQKAYRTRRKAGIIEHTAPHRRSTKEAQIASDQGSFF
jgi:hypothetical protein